MSSTRGCNYISSVELLCRATANSLTLISGAADKVTSPTLIPNQKQVPLKELKKTSEEIINTLMLTLDTSDHLQDRSVERYRMKQTNKMDTKHTVLSLMMTAYSYFLPSVAVCNCFSACSDTRICVHLSHAYKEHAPCLYDV